MQSRNLFTRLAALLMLGALCGGAQAAADWPAQPITIIVPFPPGGATDVMARLFAPRIEAAIGRPVVVENKSGAGGTIGTQQVARARNDGYTLLWGTVATHGIGPNIYKKLSYDAVADFEPVVHVVDQPYVLVAHPSTKISSVAELRKQAQARPGRFRWLRPASARRPTCCCASSRPTPVRRCWACPTRERGRPWRTCWAARWIWRST